jgi:electron transport complex protein RnfE
MNQLQNLTKGFFKENPVFVMLLGMCPTLATTTSANNGLGMGLATTFVLVMANIAISLIKNLVPDKVRIPIYIVVVAAFVTVVDLVMAAHIAKSHQPTRMPKLGKECVCFNVQLTDNQHERQKVSTQQRFGVMTGPALHMTVLW